MRVYFRQLLKHIWKRNTMGKYIANKTCVITGGADGIGFNIADKYLQNNAKTVILVDLNESGEKAKEHLNNKYGERRADFIKCDVTKDLETTYKVIIEKYKYIDVLVNSAGIADETVPRKMMEINATAVIEWSVAFSKHMRKDAEGKGGTIINIASVLGFTIAPYGYIYQASKFAVTAFTRSLGHQFLYPTTGVRTISLCPGLTKTRMIKDASFKKHKMDIEIEMVELLTREPIQEVDAVGEAAVKILERAESGSMWAIVGGELKNVSLEIKYNV